MNSGNSYHGLDVYAVKLIRFKARQLSRLPFFGSEDIEDLEQELAMDLHRRMSRFDPGRASKNTFMARVIENRAASLVTAATAPSRYSGQPSVSLEETGESWLTNEAMATGVSPSLSEGSSGFNVEMAFDLGRCFQCLSKEQQRLCLLLPFHKPSVISLEMGWSRATFFRRLAGLRETFKKAGLENYLVAA